MKDCEQLNWSKSAYNRRLLNGHSLTVWVLFKISTLQCYLIKKPSQKKWVVLLDLSISSYRAFLTLSRPCGGRVQHSQPRRSRNKKLMFRVILKTFWHWNWRFDTRLENLCENGSGNLIITITTTQFFFIRRPNPQRTYTFSSKVIIKEFQAFSHFICFP